MIANSSLIHTALLVALIVAFGLAATGNAPGVLTETTAELALALTLALMLVAGAGVADAALEAFQIALHERL